VGPGYLFMAMQRSETLFQNDSLDLRNTLARNCKGRGHGELAPKDYFHGRTLSPVSGIAASHAAGKVASPSGSGVLGLPGRRVRGSGIAGALPKAQRVERVGEVRVQTMGCF